ncbi:hypothetical protein BW425_11695 [Bacillus pseudomycoides]|uniref:Uncharacterized protein n=1 Tax=Bacillus pseudomycoides TaxID=64104 RepID=A0A1Y3MJI6_9BACI|nr:hypothetical protein BW425_11695 [Bacillus pseudomycoides]
MQKKVSLYPAPTVGRKRRREEKKRLTNRKSPIGSTNLLQEEHLQKKVSLYYSLSQNTWQIGTKEE